MASLAWRLAPALAMFAVLMSSGSQFRAVPGMPVLLAETVDGEGESEVPGEETPVEESQNSESSTEAFDLIPSRQRGRAGRSWCAPRVVSQAEASLAAGRARSRAFAPTSSRGAARGTALLPLRC